MSTGRETIVTTSSFIEFRDNSRCTDGIAMYFLEVNIPWASMRGPVALVA